MKEVKKQGIQSLFVPYEEALALKELGFDKYCFGIFYGESLSTDFDPAHHDINLKCPLYQQAFRWFREKYNLHQVILVDEKGKYDIIVGKRISGSCLGQYKTYKEAELECIKKLIEIVKNDRTKI